MIARKGYFQKTQAEKDVSNLMKVLDWVESSVQHRNKNAAYHSFDITDDSEGGYLQKT